MKAISSPVYAVMAHFVSRFISMVTSTFDLLNVQVHVYTWYECNTLHHVTMFEELSSVICTVHGIGRTARAL